MPSPYSTGPDKSERASAVSDLVLGDAPDVERLAALGAALTAPTVEWAPEEDEAARYVGVVVPDGYQLKIEELPAGERTAPKRMQGTVAFHDVASWMAYVHHWAGAGASGEEPNVFADGRACTLTAVLDPPSPAAVDWGNHRAAITFTPSDEWKAWEALDGRLVSQEAFAEFVGEQRRVFREPDQATMLEVAQTFRAVTRVTFESGYRLHDGQRTYQYQELTQTSAGGGNRSGQRAASIEVPDEFTIALMPWEGLPYVVQITAQLRSRNAGGSLELGFKLVRPKDARDRAWDAVVADVRDGREADDYGPAHPGVPGGTLVVKGAAPQYRW